MTATAYSTGSASTMSDLVTALFTFATANGWTQLDLDTANGEASMHADTTLFAQFRWATSTPTSLAAYQALGYGHGLATVTSIAAGGTGYSVGDVLTLVGGTPTTAGTATVTAESGGVVTAAEVTSAGINYTATPTNPVSTTGGAGTCTLNCTFRGTASSTTPGNSCDDSGSSLITGTDTTLDDSRGLVGIGNGPYTSHHFFIGTNPAGDPYLHVIVEFSPGLFRHMGFGHIDKIGDWTGGEYCYGHFPSIPTSTSTTCLLDGVWVMGSSGNTRYRGATIRMESFLSQAATGKWGVCTNSSASISLNDRAGNARQHVCGGFRGGPIATSNGWIASNVGNAFVPMYGIVPMYVDYSSSPDQAAFMGTMPDVKGVNIRGFTAKQVVTVGADDWMMFPVSRKSSGVGADDSLNQGIAYLRP